VILAAVVAFGLAWGSFANVLIARVPAGQDWVREPSHCPTCGHPIAWHDNIPVLSWLWLSRRCRHCRRPISARYPLVEFLVAGAFAAIYLLFGATLVALALAYLALISVVLAAIDLDVRRLPDSIVLPAYPALVVLLCADSAVVGEWWPLARAAVGALALAGFYLGMLAIYPRGMGWGDVKTAGILGLALGYLGWAQLGVGAFFGPILGGLAVLPGLLIGRVSLKTRVPYGPALIVGAWLGLFAGSELFGMYVRLFT
jgi:leader peptidase (prepilin peptidase) / N-methyltransferase